MDIRNMRYVTEKEFVKATTTDPAWSYTTEGSKALYKYFIERQRQQGYVNFLCKCCFYKNLQRSLFNKFEEYKSIEQWNDSYSDNQITDISDLFDFTEVIYDYSNKSLFIVDIDF
jgi:hypothetical protein